MLKSRRQFLCMLAGVAGTAGAAAIWTRGFGSRPPLRSDEFPVFQKTSWALGSSVSLTVMHDRADQAEKAIDAGFKELELVESLLSLYRPNSQLCKLNRDKQLAAPHPYLVEVLAAARAMSEKTGGAFDITVQPLWELYSTAQKSGTLPSETDIEEARKRIDWRHVEFDEHQVQLKSPGTAVTLNGIAQGFAADRVSEVLRSYGICHALIDTGEFGSLGAKSTGDEWKIGIQHPRFDDHFLSVAELANRCLATSGDYSTFFSNDFRHHHLFDPKTGHSPAELSSVSIATTTALLADALSTAVFVLGPEAGMRLVRETPETDALLVLKDGTQLSTESFPFST